MSAPTLWSGSGVMEPGQVYWTKTRSQEMVGTEYVRREIRKRLGSSSWFRQLTQDGQREVLEAVLSDAWLRGRGMMTVGCLVRDAKDAALDAVLMEMGTER